MLQLFRIMASTPNRSWAGSAVFGLRDLLEQARTRPESLRVALETANAALRDLGITAYSVEQLVRLPSSTPGAEHFDMVLARSDGSQQPITLNLRLSD